MDWMQEAHGGSTFIGLVSEDGLRAWRVVRVSSWLLHAARLFSPFGAGLGSRSVVGCCSL